MAVDTTFIKVVCFVISLTEIEMSYRSIAGLGERLSDIREENSRHSQVFICLLVRVRAKNIPRALCRLMLRVPI